MDEPLVYARTAAGKKALQQPGPPLSHELRELLDAVDGVTNAAEFERRLEHGEHVDAGLEELERRGLIRRLAARPQLWEVVLGAGPSDEPAPLAGSALPDPAPSESGAADRGDLSGLLGSWSAWRRKWAARQDEKAFRRAYETPSDDDRFAPVEIKPIRRGRRRKMSWLLSVISVLMLFAIGILLLALLFPYQRYRPEIERRLGATWHDPVRISEVRFSFRPYPNITLAGVAVGAEPDAEIKAIRVLPDPFSLFGPNWIVTHMRVEDMVIHNRGIGSSARWLSGAAGQAETVLVRGARFERLSVDLGNLRLTGLSGELSAASEGGAIQILLHKGDLHLRLEPTAAGYRLSVQASALAIPFGMLSDPTVTQLDLQGEIRPGLLHLAKIDGRLYGGFVAGTADLAWSQTASLVADIQLRSVSSERLWVSAATGLSMQGDLSGKFHVGSRAAKLAGLAEHLRVDGDFLVERGAIEGLDLIEAVRSKHQTRGGITRFERFTGELRLDGPACHLGRLVLSSSLMRAEGHLDIASDRRIGGLMAIELTGAATRIHAPIAIAGTLDEPQIEIGRRARIRP